MIVSLFGFVDVPLGNRRGSLDLLGDFSVRNSYGISGRLWVELKCFSSSGFETKLRRQKGILEGKLEEVMAIDDSVEGVLLVISNCARDGPCHWQVLLLRACLYAEGDWVDVGVERRRARGRVQGIKRNLSEVFAEMEWFWRPGMVARGAKLGLLAHFLSALGLSKQNATGRAAHFNKLLEEVGSVSKLEQVALPNRDGKAPWMGTKAVFRALYKRL